MLRKQSVKFVAIVCPIEFVIKENEYNEILVMSANTISNRNKPKIRLP